MNATTCSYNAIFGEFNSQGIFIDMEANVEDWNVFSASIHELTHSFIEFDSYYLRHFALTSNIEKSSSSMTDCGLPLNCNRRRARIIFGLMRTITSAS